MALRPDPLVRQALFALQGICGDVFVHEEGDSDAFMRVARTPSSLSWSSPGVSNGCVDAVLARFTRFCNRVFDLQNMYQTALSEALSLPASSLVLQAFAAWACGVLSRFRMDAVLCVRDNAAGSGPLTLLALQAWLSSRSEAVDVLWAISTPVFSTSSMPTLPAPCVYAGASRCTASKSANYLLDALLTLHEELELTSSTERSPVCELVWSALCACLQPALAALDAWMAHGEPPSSAGAIAAVSYFIACVALCHDGKLWARYSKCLC